MICRLCDAESNFLIRTRKNEKGEVGGFEFVFKIVLHTLALLVLILRLIFLAPP